MDRNTVIGMVLLAILFFTFFWYTNKQQQAIALEQQRITDSTKKVNESRVTPEQKAAAYADSVHRDSLSKISAAGNFAQAANGKQVEEDGFDFGEDRYDLCVAIGTLDSVNDLPLALHMIGRALRNDAPFIGAIAGGNSLATLRSSLIEAGRALGRIVGRAHPRIDPSSLGQLLSTAGFSMPVVDIDRVTLRYATLGDLLVDLRAMGATAVMTKRPPAFTKSEAALLQEAFSQAGENGRTDEVVEILHFLCWSQ